MENEFGRGFGDKNLRRTVQFAEVFPDGQPVLVVAAYSALLLAALLTFGPQRTDDYAKPPKWRRKAKRPSCLDLMTLLRKEMHQHPEMLIPLEINTSLSHLARATAA